MKNLFAILSTLLIIGLLTGCAEKDEFEKYNIETTDIVQALENDKNLTSVKIKFIDYNIEDDTTFEVEYMIDSNIGYSEEFDTYYEKMDDFALCTMQYDQLLGDGYTRHGTMKTTYQFLSSAEEYVYKHLQSGPFEVNDYVIEGEYYKYELPLSDNLYVYIRVNSQNYIDYFKVIKIVENEEILYEEHFLSDHNNTTLELPESKYMSPFEYQENVVLSNGFTKTILSETEISYSNDSFEAAIDFLNQTILFSKNNETVLYASSNDNSSVMLLLENEDFGDMIMLMLEYERIESGRYTSCLED